MKKPFVCLSCDTPGLFSEHTRTGRYCDNQCQKDHQWSLEKIQIKKTGCFINNRQAKRFLLERDGRRCALCDRKTWEGEPIPLVLDHIDGKHTNLRIANYRLICPNCDAQTPTFKGKNRGNGKNSRRARYHAGQTY